jgi:hypothetical protein
MIIDYVNLIIPAAIGAIVATTGNLFYYRYTSSKEKNIKFLKMQITELLLPLYAEFKNMEFSAETLGRHPAIEQYGNWNIIDEIIRKKLWLADTKLSQLLLQYLIVNI